jgi:hypothetical protein
VVYPEDGYLYLYPRVVDGRLRLLQMVHEVFDLDDQLPLKPVFDRAL